MKLRDLFFYKHISQNNFSIKDANSADDYPVQKNHGGPELAGNFRKDFKTLKEEFAMGKSGDIKMREFTVMINEKEHDAVIFFIDGLVNKQFVNDFILKPLMLKSREIYISSFRAVGDVLLSQSEYKETNVIG